MSYLSLATSSIAEQLGSVTYRGNLLYNVVLNNPVSLRFGNRHKTLALARLKERSYISNV